MSRNYASFYVEDLLGYRPTPKLEDHPLSAFRDWLFNIFAVTLHIGGRFPIRNLRTRHAVVTGTHLLLVLMVLTLQKALEKRQDRMNRLWPDSEYWAFWIWSRTVSHYSAANKTTQSELQMELQYSLASRYIVQCIHSNMCCECGMATQPNLYCRFLYWRFPKLPTRPQHAWLLWRI
jgi:hypothetical protein